MKNGQKMKNKVWEIYNLIIDWIKFADAKAGLFLALNTGVAAFVATGLFQDRVLTFVSSHLIVKWSLIFCIIFWLINSIFLILCLNPCLKTPENKSSLVFYGDIASKYDFPEDLYKKYDETTEEIFIKDDLIPQLCYVSDIAKMKFNNIKIAIWFYFPLITSFVICIMATIF